MYDVAQALIGFQRSLALTTHLVLNGKIITQSPSLKGAKIFSLPPEPGSWKFTAIVVAAGTGIFNLGTLERTSPLGHLVHSMYDYVVSESLGFHVDYEQSLGQQYENYKKTSPPLPLPEIRQSQADSLIEKCSTAIHEMHRPIYMSNSADAATLNVMIDQRSVPLHSTFDLESFDYIHETRKSDVAESFAGRITSYNSNTYKGRIYIHEIGRPVSFELAPLVRGGNEIRLITTSLRSNAMKQFREPGSVISIAGLKNTSRNGKLKTLTIVSVTPFSGE